MSNSSNGLLKEELVCLLLLAVIGGLLFAIFTFLATAVIAEAMAVALFLIVAGLLMGGYVMALMVLALIGRELLAKRSSGTSKQSSVQHSA